MIHNEDFSDEIGDNHIATNAVNPLKTSFSPDKELYNFIV